MTDKLFDDFVKDKLKSYDSGAPMHVWERIREKDKSDKKGFFFFRRYWLTGIALFAITGIAYLTWNAVSKSKAVSNYSTQNEKLKIQQENKNQTSTEINKIQKEQNANPGTEKEKIGTASNIPTENQLQTENKNSNLTSVNTSTAVIKKSDLKYRNKFNQTVFNKGFVNKQSSNALISKDKYSDLVVPSSKSEDKEWALNFTDPAAFKFSNRNFKIGNVPQPNNKPSCPTISGPRRNDLYIEVYGSPDYTLRSFSNTSAFNGYIAQRKTTENNRNGFSAGVLIAKNINEKALLKAGLNYSQINERLKVINENEKQLTQIITIRTIIRAPGDTLYIRDTTYFEQSGTRYRTFYNRYRFIDLPILFSYEFGNPDILSFSINAGPVINITSFYKGSILDTTYNPVKITTAKGNAANNWRHNIGLGFMGSIAMYKRMNERLQIFAEPYFRYNLKPVTQNSNVVNQRYFISGMKLGLRYNLHTEKQRYR
jgi:hypothetical protein